MKKKNAHCPYFSYKLSYKDLFNIKPNQLFKCPNCGRMIEPKFHRLIEKTWNYTFYIGVYAAIIFCLIPFLITKDIILSLKIGIIPILITLPLYLFFLKKTTFLVKY